MADHEPTIRDDGEQDGEALDAELLPDEFPDDRPLVSRDYGTTEAEQARREPLDRRLRREEPDPGSLPSSDDDGADGDRVGRGDDGPDLLSQLDEDGRDMVKELVAERGQSGDGRDDDTGQPRLPRSAEEDAVHVVDEDDEVREVVED